MCVSTNANNSNAITDIAQPLTIIDLTSVRIQSQLNWVSGFPDFVIFELDFMISAAASAIQAISFQSKGLGQTKSATGKFGSLTKKASSISKNVSQKGKAAVGSVKGGKLSKGFNLAKGVAKGGETADGVRLYAAYPAQVLAAGEPAPVVLLLHQFYGLTRRETELCDALAALGCVAIAPDTFQRQSTSWVPHALALVAGAALGPGATWGAEDLSSTLRWVEAQPWGEAARVGLVGFCYGGGAALRCAEAHPGEVAAVASFYGAPLEDAGRLTCPVLGVYGTADTQFPPAAVERFEKHLAAMHVDATVLRFQARQGRALRCEHSQRR